MIIVPTANILIKGVHAEVGQPFETDDATARILIADRQAVRLVAPAKESAPVIETAEADPAPETAIAPSAKSKRRK